jgi:V/A-type H+-transporting ATPase subunit B
MTQVAVLLRETAEFERRYITQGEEEDRPIEQTLNIGWDLLSLLPVDELTRVREEFIEKYLPKAGEDEAE